MGNDEHSQNVFRRARELGEGSACLLRSDGPGVHRGLAAPRYLVRRLHPHHRATAPRRVQRLVRADAAAGDIYEGVYEGWYCVSCEAFKQEKDLVEGLCPVHQTRPDWIREKNYFFRLSSYREPLLAHYAANPAFLQPDVRRNEILRLLEAAWRTSPSAGQGSRGGFHARRSRQRDLRLVRRAHQLHRPPWASGPTMAVRTMVAGRPARHREGHHALPLRDLAGDAHERRCAAARGRCSATAGSTSRARR
jgi:hypothetical protein